MSARIARTLASLMYVGSPDRRLLDELNLLDVLARGLAIQRELAADDLDDLGVAALSELFGGLAGGKAGAIEHGALNELVLLQVGDRLLDGALVDIGLTDDDGGVEVMGHAAKLLDLGSCQCHGFSLSMYGAPHDGALIYVSCPTIAQERRGVGRVCPVQKECGCRAGERRGLQADVYDGRKRSMDGSKRPAPMQ